MPSSKSQIIKKLADNYPNFIKKDLNKIVEIFISEVKNALKRNERVELRDVFSLEARLQKARVSRNPKTNEKVDTEEKKSILFKMSKDWTNKINEKK